jgi:hypothetical protein
LLNIGGIMKNNAWRLSAGIVMLKRQKGKSNEFLFEKIRNTHAKIRKLTGSSPRLVGVVPDENIAFLNFGRGPIFNYRLGEGGKTTAR